MAFTLWLTGLPSIGKTTTANQVLDRLTAMGYTAEVLDSDDIAPLFGSLLDLDAVSRDIVARSMAVTAKILNKRGIICICAATMPRQAIRSCHRNMIPHYIEVYCKGDVRTARKRDTRGLYALADKGIIKEFTGVDEPYEAPETPELVLDMDSLSPNACVQSILSYIQDYLEV